MSVKEKLSDLKAKRAVIEQGGGIKAVEKQHSQGKLTARERIQILLDKDSFVELDQFVVHRCNNFGMEKKQLPADGVVTGYGTVDGRLVYVFSQDFTVAGGSLGEYHANKIVKVQDLALKMGAPLVGINDSGGARIHEAVDALSGFGKIFYRNTISSGVIPQISVIMGPCAGGAVYSPAITDFIFMVEKTGKMFITGPDVIKAVTAEEVTQDELGGANTHNNISGVAHFKASNDEDCLLMVRELLGYLPSNNLDLLPEKSDFSVNDQNKLMDLMPDNPNFAYDMKALIEVIADNDSFFEVQAGYAQNMICAFVRIEGQTVGIIANQPMYMAGCLDINASDKAARFIRFCDAFSVPVLNIVDVPGFLPGKDQEHGGIIRHGAKMLYAYSEATVPKITLITRKAYGGSYLAMCCQELGADMVLAWPTAEIAVMGPDGAANIIFRGDPNIDARKEQYVKDFGNPYRAAERGFVDQVIDPVDSRDRIISALRMLNTKRESRPAKKHGNIPL